MLLRLCYDYLSLLSMVFPFLEAKLIGLSLKSLLLIVRDEGILAGAAKVFSGVRCLINEVKCRCLGSSYCEFIVSWRKLRACGFSP